jgi:hypothetical protein
MGNAGRKFSALEIVLVKNEHVDLFASLFTLENNQAMVHGRVILGNEKKLCFSSDQNFRGALRSEFLSACRSIADYYGAEFFTQKLSLRSAAGMSSKGGRSPFHLLNQAPFLN